MPPTEHPKADKTPSFKDSSFKPQDEAKNLERWWSRPVRPTLPGDPKDLSYLPFKVKVITNTRNEEKGTTLLTFTLARREEADPSKHLTVNLPVDWSIAWGDYPSTAQLAKAGEYGFLFLSEKWAMEKELTSLAEGGGKWPIGAGSIPPTILQVLSDEKLREKLLALAQSLIPGHDSNG